MGVGRNSEAAMSAVDLDPGCERPRPRPCQSCADAASEVDPQSRSPAPEPARSPDGFDADWSEKWRQALARIVESVIVPRLISSHDSASEPEPILSQQRMDGIGDFVRILLQASPEEALSNVKAKHGQFSFEQLLLEVLAPAARRLGELWESDLCDFMEVTVGLQRLQAIQRLLARECDLLDEGFWDRPGILLLNAPGDQHGFGLALVADVFRCAGWRVEAVATPGCEAVLANRWFDLVGFSLGCSRHVEELKLAVQRARRASMNPSILVLVGGPAFLENPDLAGRIGADATAADAPSAVHCATDLLNRHTNV